LSTCRAFGPSRIRTRKGRKTPSTGCSVSGQFARSSFSLGPPTIWSLRTFWSGLTSQIQVCVCRPCWILGPLSPRPYVLLFFPFHLELPGNDKDPAEFWSHLFASVLCCSLSFVLLFDYIFFFLLFFFFICCFQSPAAWKEGSCSQAAPELQHFSQQCFGCLRQNTGGYYLPDAALQYLPL